MVISLRCIRAATLKRWCRLAGTFTFIRLTSSFGVIEAWESPPFFLGILLYSYTHRKLSSILGWAAPPTNISLPGPWFADQILPFDITIALANEYGAGASAKLFGVEILNEGFGTSVDDSVIEQQATFVAQTIAPLQAVGNATLIAGA